MTDQELKMAIQCQLLLAGNREGLFADALKKFADLVRADEREACAKLVEPDEEHRRDASWGYLGGEEGVELLDGKAKAIRARGEQ